MEQIEGVRGIIDEIDAIRDGNQTKQCARSRRGASCVIDKLDRYLFTGERISLDDIAIIAIGGEDVMIRRECKAEGIIESSACRDGKSGSCRVPPEESTGKRRDPIVEAVGDVEVPGIVIERDTSWTDD